MTWIGIVVGLAFACGGAGSTGEEAPAPADTQGDEASAPAGCAVTLCPAPSRCVEESGAARCVPIEPAPQCGGIAGCPCPGAGQCVDDPNDSCDPEHGGADCGGVCACNALGMCVEGSVWDESPAVCGCVPNG